jgi:hypothetical protein
VSDDYSNVRFVGNSFIVTDGDLLFELRRYVQAGKHIGGYPWELVSRALAEIERLLALAERTTPMDG